MIFSKFVDEGLLIINASLISAKNFEGKEIKHTSYFNVNNKGGILLNSTFTERNIFLGDRGS